jgi:predicted RNase H-like HicB family nuclease
MNRKNKTKIGVSGHSFTATFEPAEEGGFVVTVPALPGCISEGDNYEEALDNIREAIIAYIESLKKHGEIIPPDIQIITRVEVAI